MKLKLVNTFKDEKTELATKEIYMNSFPADERWDWDGLKECDQTNSHYNADSVINELDEVVGILFCMEDEDFAHLFYLAVREDLRNHHLGSDILNLFKNKYAGKKMFLSAESLRVKADDMPMRLRRVGFYKRNGFIANGVGLSEYGVIYDMLSLDGVAISYQNYYNLVSKAVPGLDLSNVLKEITFD